MEQGSKISPLDTQIDIVTPENIKYPTKLAGPFIRAWAFILDITFIHLFMFALMVLWVVIFVGLSGIPQSEFFIKILFGTGLLLYAFLFWFGLAIQEGFFGGKTIGKSIFGLRTLTVEGQPISKYQAILRNVLRAADLAAGPFLLLFMGGNSRFMRFGDVAAGTLVVREEKSDRKRELLAFRHPEILKIAAAIPPDFKATESLERFLSFYIHRRAEISPNRRWELAHVLALRIRREGKIAIGRVSPDLFLCALYQAVFLKQNPPREKSPAANDRPAFSPK